ncbi:alpha/beta hydrolase family protein [Planctomycetota bacterium]
MKKCFIILILQLNLLLMGNAEESYKQQEWTFKNGELCLGGVLLIPNGEGPYPVLICVHGSGGQDREQFQQIDAACLENGIAVLRYDKRGVGVSKGDWKTSDLNDLAGDVLAAAASLKKCKDIDAAKIGLIGVSQGGWVIALAAAESSDIAFIVSVVGSAQTPREQDRTRMIHMLTANGFDEAAIKEVGDMNDQLWQFIMGEIKASQIRSLLDAASQKKWFKVLFGDLSVDFLFKHLNEQKVFLAKIAGHDPVPILKKIQCPVIAFFGEKDPMVPPDINVPVWEKALEEGPCEDFEVKVFSDTGHNLSKAMLSSAIKWIRERFIDRKK